MRRLRVLILGGGLLLASCTSAGPHWGANAAYVPSHGRVVRALHRAATDPRTWVPAVGAAVFSLGDLDENVSEWASRETPIFGSTDDADAWSGRLRNVTRFTTLTTAALADSGQRPGQIAINKLRGLSVDAAAWLVSDRITEGVKGAVGRERPNLANDKSFPSGRAADASVLAALSDRNLEYVHASPGLRRAARAALTGVSVLTAWARVEAKAHYPSDVLAGMALGNFVGVFMHDAFLARPCDCWPASRR